MMNEAGNLLVVSGCGLPLWVLFRLLEGRRVDRIMQACSFEAKVAAEWTRLMMAGLSN